MADPEPAGVVTRVPGCTAGTCPAAVADRSGTPSTPCRGLGHTSASSLAVSHQNGPTWSAASSTTLARVCCYVAGDAIMARALDAYHASRYYGIRDTVIQGQGDRSNPRRDARPPRPGTVRIRCQVCRTASPWPSSATSAACALTGVPGVGFVPVAKRELSTEPVPEAGQEVAGCRGPSVGRSRHMGRTGERVCTGWR